MAHGHLRALMQEFLNYSGGVALVRVQSLMCVCLMGKTTPVGREFGAWDIKTFEKCILGTDS